MSVPEPDFAKLAMQGFCILENVVDSDKLDAFEEQILAIGRAECAKLAIDPGAEEPLAAALRSDQDYRTYLFGRLKQLWVLQEITALLVGQLRAGGFFAQCGIHVPSIYQTLKGDLPDEDSYTLPFHQDYRLTRSHRAYRLWIPLRDVGKTKGSMELASGSHKDRFDYVVEGTDYPYIPEKRIVGAYESELLTLAAGSAVLFNPLIVHRSVPNKGQRIKLALIVHIEDATALFTPEEMARRWPYMPI